VYDLVEALQKALEVRDRKVLREMDAPKVSIPEKRRDISEVMKEIYARIKTMFGAGKRLTLTTLIPSQNREDVIQTFIPLLHLSHVSHRKIDLEQKEHFGEIEIKLVA
jgi:chromatin segregation and condensation protein Rec8/ScpA/Scc1 (kleisin family)